MPQTFNILISSAGRRVALVQLFQNALQELGIRGNVLAADLTSASSAWHVADRAADAPRFATGRFIDDMLALCKREKIKLLVPTIDTELPLYAAAKNRFKEIGTEISISSPEAIRICNDKIETHHWLSSLGMPLPRQASIAEVLDSPDDWPTPLIAKPKHGSSSTGMHRIHEIDDLKLIKWPELMIIETVASGEEFTIDLYIDRTGKPRCAVPRQRLETRSGEVSKGMTVRHPGLQSIASQIASELPGGFGVINIQAFLDQESGDINIIEINPRFGGGYPLTEQAGATCTHWLIEDCLGLPLSVVEDTWRDGLAMLRYDDAVFVDKNKIKHG